MPFVPDDPFPKAQGDIVRSKDWNDAVNELLRLDTAKVNKAGDAMTGPLSINIPASNSPIGALSVDVQSFSTPGNAQNSFYFRVRDIGAGPNTPFYIRGDGNVGIGTTNPAAKLNVSSDEPQLRIDGSGNRALIQFAKSGALQWDFGVGTGAAGNNDFWFGDFASYRMILQKGTGNVGIGTTAPYTQLTLTGPLGFTNATTPMIYIYETGTNNPERPIIAHSPAFPTWGLSYRDVGDMMVFQGSGSPKMVVQLGTGRIGIGTDAPGENLTVDGTVRLGSGGQQVHIGGNRTGPFLQLNDDLWFSDPQNGTIRIRNFNDSNWGTLVGIFTNVSSRQYKKDVTVLHEVDLDQLLAEALSTKVVNFRYKGDDEKHRLRLGVIAEECPARIVGDDGESISTAEYASLLHGAIKALANQLSIAVDNFRELRAENENLKAQITKLELKVRASGKKRKSGE